MPQTTDNPVVIKLYGGGAPSVGRIVGWALAGNFIVILLSGIFFGLIPWLGGEKPQLTLFEIIGIGVVAAAVALGIAIFMGRKHLRDAVRTPAAQLAFDDDHVHYTRMSDDSEAQVPRPDVEPRLLHLYEQVDGQEYYVGPAISLRLGDQTVVVTLLDAAVRWRTNPPSTDSADWIARRDGFDELLEIFDLDDVLVAY
jgi:hypothetical protein